MKTTFPPVLTKRDFVDRYIAGEFGNRSPTWPSIDDWVNADCPYAGGLFHIRNRVAGGPTYYNLKAGDLVRKWYGMEMEGVDMTSYYLSAMAPTEQTTLQGEVQQSERGGLDLYYSCIAKPMRDALREAGYRATGLTAHALLDAYLCPRSRDWLRVLLDRYPEHVVEFSAYRRCWGSVPGYNTLFWEVRLY